MAITIPNTFVAGTKIEASPMNANFAEVANAVDKRGDTVTGNIAANAGVKFDGVDLSTIPNSSGTFDPLFAQVVIGTADTNGIRLDLETGTLAVREGDDSAYAPLISGLLTTSGNHVPASNDGGSLGISGTAWADLFLASGGVLDWNAGNTTLTQSAGKLTIAGSGAGALDVKGAVSPTANDGAALGSATVSWADLFLASGGVLNFNNGDVTVTHSSNTLTFAGAASGYIFNDGNVGIGATPGVPFEVKKTGVVAAGDWYNIAKIYDGSGNKGLQLGYDNTAQTTILAASTSSAASNMAIYTYSGSAWAEAMRITSLQRVGIGTTSPDRKLQVQVSPTSTGDDGIRVSNGTYTPSFSLTGSAYTYRDVPANAAMIYNGGPIALLADAASTISFHANGAERARITSGGNLAIAATAKFYLDGVAGTGDTYLHENSANSVQLSVGNQNHTYKAGIFAVSTSATNASSNAISNLSIGYDANTETGWIQVIRNNTSETRGLQLNPLGNFVSIKSGSGFYLDNGGDTYIAETNGNEVSIYCGGNQELRLDTSTLLVPNVYSDTTASAANVFVDSNGRMSRSTSSGRYKHDIETLDGMDAVSAVMAMRPISYRGKTDADQRKHVGFIAEEMAEIAPLLCTYDEGGESGTPNYVTYDRVTAYLVAVVQQQQTEIAALKARLN